MHIYLMLDHTALLEDDHRPAITVEPACEGVLEIEGRRYAVDGDGKTPFHPLHELTGQVQVTYAARGGCRYEGVNPHMIEGVPCSRVDYAAEYAHLRIHQDELERQIEKLTEYYHKLRAESVHDALGFLTHNTRNTEVPET